VTEVEFRVLDDPYAVVVPYDTWESAAWSVVQTMVALHDVMEPALTADITGAAAGALFTVTETLLLALFAAVSVATAVRVWEPLAAVVVFQDVL
jgi:hypothetical protein